MEALNGIRFILYIIIIIVSIVNIIKFYTKKGKKKGQSAKNMEGISSHRALRAEESDALFQLYKKEVASGSPVYRIKGQYESEILRVNNSNSERVTTIGEVLVLFDDSMTSLLEEDNSVEIVCPENKKGAYILTLNSGYSAVEEASVRKALQEGKSYQKRTSPGPETGASTENPEQEASFEFHPGREISPEEENWLFSDYRVLPSLGFVVLITAALLVPLIAVKAGLALLSLFLLSLVLRPDKSRKNKKKKNLISLSGILKKENAAYRIGRFSLLFPKDWEGKVSIGQKIQVEAYPQDIHSNILTVLSLNGLYSIQKQERREPTRKKHRFVLLTVLSLLLLFINLLIGKLPKDIRTAQGYLVSLKNQEDFYDAETIRNFPFKKGQFVRFRDISILPAVYQGEGALFAAPEGNEQVPDLQPLRDRLAAMRAVQQTREMIYLTYLVGENNDAWESFLYEYFWDPDIELMDDSYNSAFPGNTFYPIVKELGQSFLNWEEDMTLDIDDPIRLSEGGALKAYFGEASESMSYRDLAHEITEIRSGFFSEELDHLVDTLEAAYKQIEGEQSQDFRLYSKGFTTVNLHFSKEDLVLFVQDEFSLPNFTNEIVKRDRLKGEDRLNSLQDFFADPYEKISLSGVIDNLVIGNNGQDTVGIRINQDRDYLDIPFVICDLLLILVCFGAALSGGIRIKS